MPQSPRRHNQSKVEQNRLANQKEYNQKRREGQEFYNGRPWRKLRARFLRDNPLCKHCKENGLIVAGVVVDHIKPIKDGGDKYSASNLQTLCNYHHGVKTAEDLKE